MNRPLGNNNVIGEFFLVQENLPRRETTLILSYYPFPFQITLMLEKNTAGRHLRVY